jgi:hypothetical protein
MIRRGLLLWGWFGAALLAPVSLQACPFCAEAVRRINNGHLLDSYFFAYVILAFMPLLLISLFALTLYRHHRRKTADNQSHR